MKKKGCHWSIAALQPVGFNAVDRLLAFYPLAAAPSAFG
jgi:hypothetical protein